MKSLALVLMMAAASASAAGEPAIYVRGAFNGWGTDNPLAYKGERRLRGRHPGQPRQPRLQDRQQGLERRMGGRPVAPASAVAPGTAYPLATPMPVPRTTCSPGRPRPTASASTSSDPAQAGAEREPRRRRRAGPAIDPHAGARASATLNFPTWDGKQETRALFHHGSAGAAAQLRAIDHDAAARPRPAIRQLHRGRRPAAGPQRQPAPSTPCSRWPATRCG